jgi:hypothetical protein
MFADPVTLRRIRMLRRSVLAAVMIIVGAGVSFGQVEQQVMAIRAEVAAINKNAPKYKKKNKDVTGVSLEGAAATYFTSGKGLKKITAKLYGETYNASVEIYYQGEEAIFIYSKMNKYDTQIGMTPAPKVVRVEEERYYFTGGELIRLLSGKKEVKPADERYNEMKEGILEVAKGLREAY